MAISRPHPRPRRRLRGLVALPLVAGFVGSGLLAPGVVSAQTGSLPGMTGPTETTTQAPDDSATSAPSEVRLDRVRWITANRVALFVQSPAMEETVQVQLMLPQSWNSEPDRTYPSLLLLDGLRARDDASGWTLETKIDQFFDAKNAVIVLPVGGESSFYTDWVNDANGSAYQWETFLTEELPPLLESDWRVGDDHGVAGLSMGGTAAMMLAQRHPERYSFAASFSGILDLTSFGMPEAIRVAMQDAGGYNVEDMWGRPGNERWIEQDPKMNIDQLVDTDVYVSSGSGNTGPWDEPSGMEGIPTNFPGYGLELLSRMTTQTFVNRAEAKGVNVTDNFRDSGTHTWPYWQFEMTQAWPHFAATVGIPNIEDPCAPEGAIADFAEGQPELGPCLTDEYAVEGGRATDFRFGRVFWSPDTGTHSVVGAIGATYQAMDGPAGELGMPTSDEERAPDGEGRFSTFENGVIYWSPDTGAHAVTGEILELWEENRNERGEFGYPTTGEVGSPNREGSSQEFEGGTVFHADEPGANFVTGAILAEYRSLGAENSELGYPTTGEISLERNGAFTRFEGGAIYWSPGNGAHAVPLGQLFEAWGDEGYENGRLGYPTSGVDEIPGGGIRMEFENGTISISNGNVDIS